MPLNLADVYKTWFNGMTLNNNLMKFSCLLINLRNGYYFKSAFMSLERKYPEKHKYTK